MNVVDLHPEDLLDKEARGELTASERAHLDAHLARCMTCRFEREVRADFADELEGTSPESSMQRLLAFMDRDMPDEPASQPVRSSTRDATERVPASEDAPLPAPPEPRQDESPLAPPSRRGRRRVGRIVLLIAAAVLVGGVATAQGGARVWARLSASWSDTPAVEMPARAPAPSALPGVFSSATAIALERTPPDESAADETPEAPAPEVSAVPIRTAPPPETAASLFDAANHARRQGDYARAIALHRRLQALHPTSREAHVSHATVGRLLLDRGDAAAALASFDAYQAHGAGDLDEAVLVGRATALDRLGRADEARTAWQALLVAFPQTPYATHARSRTGGASTP
jgi:TolA-binding protein